MFVDLAARIDGESLCIAVDNEQDSPIAGSLGKRRRQARIEGELAESGADALLRRTIKAVKFFSVSWAITTL